jgi:hypothetical protein
MLQEEDSSKSANVMKAMLQLDTLYIEGLKRAYEQR